MSTKDQKVDLTNDVDAALAQAGQPTGKMTLRSSAVTEHKFDKATSKYSGLRRRPGRAAGLPTITVQSNPESLDSLWRCAMEPQAQASQFDMLHGGSRLSVFLYETEHPPEALSEPAYFLPVAGRLRRNDVIVACAGANKAPTWGLFMVRQIRPDAVHLEDLNAFQAERIGAFAMLRRPSGRAGGEAAKPKTPGGRNRSGSRARKPPRTAKKS